MENSQEELKLWMNFFRRHPRAQLVSKIKRGGVDGHPQSERLFRKDYMVTFVDLPYFPTLRKVFLLDQEVVICPAVSMLNPFEEASINRPLAETANGNLLDALLYGHSQHPMDIIPELREGAVLVMGTLGTGLVHERGKHLLVVHVCITTFHFLFYYNCPCGPITTVKSRAPEKYGTMLWMNSPQLLKGTIGNLN
jgi:hypothetical protein